MKASNLTISTLSIELNFVDLLTLDLDTHT